MISAVNASGIAVSPLGFLSVNTVSFPYVSGFDFDFIVLMSFIAINFMAV